jgi:hypothetical protein
MKLFRFGGTMTVSAYTEVLAETEEDARAIAEERSAELFFNGCGYTAREAWGIEEADGTVEGIELSEAVDYEGDDEEADTE